MKQFLSISFVFLIIFNSAKGQTFHPDTDLDWTDAKHLAWSNTRLLAWTDFAGPVDFKSTFMALTASSIICKPYFINDSIMLRVETVFIPKHSWKKRNDLDSFDLAHEQTHFNITELYARKLRKLIKEEIKLAKEGHTIDILFKMESGFKRLAKECDDFQTLYDKQTNHSINKSEQKQWNRSIWDELELLNDLTFKSIFIGNTLSIKD